MSSAQHCNPTNVATLCEHTAYTCPEYTNDKTPHVWLVRRALIVVLCAYRSIGPSELVS